MLSGLYVGSVRLTKRERTGGAGAEGWRAVEEEGETKRKRER